jgi:hypothetical protein
MSEQLGIKNADIVADILLNGAQTRPWDLYAILGSYAFAA